MKATRKQIQNLLRQCATVQSVGHERTPVPHYLIPGTDLELIDIIKSKLSPAEWRKFCWASAIQYCYRVLDKGELKRDCDKAITYLTWLKESE